MQSLWHSSGVDSTLVTSASAVSSVSSVVVSASSTVAAAVKVVGVTEVSYDR